MSKVTEFTRHTAIVCDDAVVAVRGTRETVPGLWDVVVSLADGTDAVWHNVDERHDFTTRVIMSTKWGPRFLGGSNLNPTVSLSKR